MDRYQVVYDNTNDSIESDIERWLVEFRGISDGKLRREIMGGLHKELYNCTADRWNVSKQAAEYFKMPQTYVHPYYDESVLKIDSDFKDPKCVKLIVSLDAKVFQN